MEEDPSSTILDAEVVGIRFSLATCHEICTASISDSSISHASQLSNPFLGLPLEFGRCESCGTSDIGKCEGHFGYIKLPVPIYHPSHISDLKKMLSLLCLNCLKLKQYKNPAASNGLTQKLLAKCCGNVYASQVTIREAKTTDGAVYLELVVPKAKMLHGFWSFLEKFGYRYESNNIRALLPYEVMKMIKRIPSETQKKLLGRGYFPQEGYVLEYLPVPPNCLSVPEVSDGVSVLSSDPSMSVLRKVLRKAEIISNSRSGNPNFESHQIEANELQSIVSQYLQVRGTAKTARDVEVHYGVNKKQNDSATKAWLDKMRTLFISKGSGFSSRSVITGESYKRINEVGIPLEVAQKITFQERVNSNNLSYLQDLVDKNLCLTYIEGSTSYSLRDSSKGHIYLKIGQVVHRRIMDGDIVFINRPPTIHKHSLQALSVYIHEDHTVKINPLICGPLGADFDGDCMHLFYPQSLAAKAEVMELFSLEKQLLSSHSGNLNLQLTTDSLLSLKMLFKRYILAKVEAQQLAMYISPSLPYSAIVKSNSEGPFWTAVQMLQSVLPSNFDCTGGQYMICQSKILRFDFSRDILSTMINEIAASIFFGKGPEEVMGFFNVLQPFLMESLFVEGFSVSLKDFFMHGEVLRSIKRSIGGQDILLKQLRSNYNELVQQQLEKCIHDVKKPIVNFILKSGLGEMIDSKSESAFDKLVQQIGFLGLQLSDRGKFYTKTLVDDMATHCIGKYCDRIDYPSAEFGLLTGCFFRGLDPYEEMVHSISTREIIVRSSRGLSEPGTLFKNLMAILRDVVICYDGTVRNVCSNSVIQFEYGVKAGDKTQLLFPPGEPVGVLAATAMSNPAYKAVLDASPNSNSSWELMKEILVCKASFKNEPIDRRVILFLNDCGCGKRYCREHAAYVVKNQLSKVSLKEVADEVMIEYQCERTINGGPETDAGLVGHIYLNKVMLEEKKINMVEVVQRCQESLKPYQKKKKIGINFKKIELFCSDTSTPCVSFIWRDGDAIVDLEKNVYILAQVICPILLETIVKGDARIISASIIWVNPDSNMWVHNPFRSPKGELALDIILEKDAIKQSGDAWRIVLDSCLGVLHLIDTSRSIPYSIKQVEGLLGVSCVFDQVIRRLASSVKIAKGVLREHLILLASSMTCGGSLVGFNTGGYKALGRQLKIQIPFTDATLFTPKKCFERAAEKCHTDTLSSIVASCSWGKRVSVGTGTNFEVLWDSKEVKSSQIDLDVYNFLNMVRSTGQEEVHDNGCLGEDVDDLFPEDNALSPEPTFGMDAAVFETQENGYDRPQENSWSSSKWTEKQTDDSAVSNSGGWSGTKNKPQTGDNSSGGWGGGSHGWDIKNDRGNNSDSSGQWGNDSREQIKKSQEPQDDSGGPGFGQNKGWGGKSGGWNSQDGKASGQWGNNSREKSSEPQDDSQGPGFGQNKGWGGKSGGWNSQDGKASGQWGNNSREKSSEPQDDSQGTGFVQNKGWGGKSGGWNSQDSKASGEWGHNSREHFQKSPEPQDDSQGSGFGQNKGWGGKSEGWNSQDSKASGQWGNTSREKSSEPQDDSHGPGFGQNKGWGGKSGGWNSQDSKASGQWGDNNNREHFRKSSEPQDDSQGSGFGQNKGWGGKSDGWNSQDDKANESPGFGNSGDHALPNQDDNGSWGRSKSPASPANQGWGGSSSGWDSKFVMSNDGDKDQWRKESRELFKKNPDGSQGWGSHAGERKNWSRPPRTPGANRDPNMGGQYTATRQRVDVFTSDEQDILKDIDPIMQNIRRIMQQAGYNDGDPLAAEDQTFILENVVEHHPDKASKMGSGVDFVMVSKHMNFQDSRCFYLVLKDGQKQDFSYRKCLDNFLKTKYPELAEDFAGKYFRKRREQNPPPTPTNEQNPPPPTPTNEQNLPPPPPTNEQNLPPPPPPPPTDDDKAS